MGVVTSINVKNTFIRFCDFCAKTEVDAHTLIAAPHGQHICDECVYVCKEIVDERRKDQSNDR